MERETISERGCEGGRDKRKKGKKKKKNSPLPLINKTKQNKTIAKYVSLQMKGPSIYVERDIQIPY